MVAGKKLSVIDNASEEVLVLGGVRPICPQTAHDKSMNTFSSDMERRIGRDMMEASLRFD